MTIDDDDDVRGLERAGRAVAEARDAMLDAAVPGVSTAELDAIGRTILRSHGARSAPRLAYGFPGWTCISVNDAVAHGVPSRQEVLRSGDIVNVDVSAELDGYWADTGASRAVGDAPAAVSELIEVTRAAQADAMAAAVAGRPLRHIGRAVERRARSHGFGVIGMLTGHGVGRSIHEPPTVPGIEVHADATRLGEGLVIAIEPFLCTGAPWVVEDPDGWTLRTPDGSLAAQVEHTMVVTSGQPLVLTA